MWTLACLRSPISRLTLGFSTLQLHALPWVQDDNPSAVPHLPDKLLRVGLDDGKGVVVHRDDRLGLEQIDRVYRAYPHLNDDDFVRERLDKWLGN